MKIYHTAVIAILFSILTAEEEAVAFTLGGIEDNKLTVIALNSSDSDIEICYISSACPQIQLYNAITDQPLAMRGDYPLITYVTPKVVVRGKGWVKIPFSVRDLKWYYSDVPVLVKICVYLDSRNNKWMKNGTSEDPWVRISSGTLNTSQIKYIEK